MRVDARDVDFIWSHATIIRVFGVNKKVTVRFDGWGKQYDETLEWNAAENRLAPLHSFSKCIKCLVDVLPKKRGRPTDEELDSLPESAPEIYSNQWPCKVQFRMPHPVVDGGEDEDDCTDAQAYLSSESNIFIQPYGKKQLPQSVRFSLKENDGMWLSSKRLKPWKTHPEKELGVLPEHFMDVFALAKKDKETPGVLPAPHAAVIEKGSLLKEKYLVHSRDGSVVRDGALREEEYDEEEEEESSSDVEEEQEEKVEDIVVTAFAEKNIERNPPQATTTTQQQTLKTPSVSVETNEKPATKKANNCVVM